MRLSLRNLFLISMILSFVVGFSNAQPVPKKSNQKSVSTKGHAKARHHRGRKSSWKRRGQQSIQADRARQIQEALIREHYLTGEPSGVWDSRTQAAMVRYQTDNGWQNKVVPDSRALIKLGLGPNYSQQQILNLPGQTDAVTTASAGPESAHTTGVSAKDKQ